jgi:hypothetical protein
MGERWQPGLKNNTHCTEMAAEAAAKTYGLKLPDTGEWARRGVTDGFTASGVNVDEMAADLQTDM